MNHESKITARIDTDLYNKVQDHFHHGQQTHLFRNIFKSLDELITSGRFDEITDYLYKGKPMTLPEVKELKDA